MEEEADDDDKDYHNIITIYVFVVHVTTKFSNGVNRGRRATNSWNSHHIMNTKYEALFSTSTWVGWSTTPPNIYKHPGPTSPSPHTANCHRAEKRAASERAIRRTDGPQLYYCLCIYLMYIILLHNDMYLDSSYSRRRCRAGWIKNRQVIARRRKKAFYTNCVFCVWFWN